MNLCRDVGPKHDQERPSERHRVVPGRHLLDVMPELRTQPRCVLDGGFAIGMHRRGERGIAVKRNAQGPRVAPGSLCERAFDRRSEVGSRVVGPVCGVEHRGAVAHGARQHVLRHVARPVLTRDRTRRVASPGRLVSEQATTRRRDSDRPTTVPARCHRHHAGGDTCTRAAARAARRPIEHPGVARHSVQIRLDHRQQAQLRCCGFGDRNHPRIEPASIEVGLVRGRPTFEEFRAFLRRNAWDTLNEVLDEEGDASKRAIAETGRRPRAGGFKELEHHGVDVGVHLLDPRNALLHQLAAADLAGSNQLPEAQGVIRVVFGKARHRAAVPQSRRQSNDLLRGLAGSDTPIG